jgi:protein farnesyltransferase subunit beta
MVTAALSVYALYETLSCNTTCIAEFGGYGGAPFHLSHTASTYAAVLSLLIIGTPEAYGSIDRDALYRFYLSCKDISGGFRVQRDGEVDARGAYTVLAVADLLGILTSELTDNSAEFLLSCQTYEGGFAGQPGNEAHGGYTYCAVAALALLHQLHRADLPALLRWLSNRQMVLEGGFSGRPNKLVDGCYSFWQGACFAILEAQAGCAWVSGSSCDAVLNREKLQAYILCCCQQLEGGLRDKPTESRDLYHSCYCTSGLSVSEYSYDSCWNASPVAVVGDASNRIAATHPIYNIRLEHVLAARARFVPATT